ncbi:MAG: ATP-dependent Clp protease proteolytic subunit, partial [Pseudomonadota bacterium]
GDKGRLAVTNEGSAVVLSWSTEVDVPMALRFEEAFDRYRDQTGTFIIDLDSPGGALREGRFVIEEIERMKDTHEIITRVRSSSVCLSMCVPIYLSGEKRIAGPASRWMFHEPRAYDYFSGEEVGESESEIRAAGARFFDRYFVNSEMNPVWRDRLAQEWVGRDVWKTGRQLFIERSNIVQELQ